MSLFSKLFGGGKSQTEAEPPTEYSGFRITPKPLREGNEYRVAALIEKDVDGATKTHHLVRADTMSDPEVAKQVSVTKAKQMIDQQGDRIFD